MLVKKYKRNYQTNNFELIREIAGVIEDKVFVEMALDLPYEVLQDLQLMEFKADYMYEAGKMIGTKFNPEYIWHSANPNLFD